MKPRSVMLVAGETSGDILAAELVGELRTELGNGSDPFTWDWQPLHTSLEPRFFGAGGPRMKAAGVDLTLDLTVHAVTGLWEVLRNLGKFRRFFHQLVRVAREQQPDAIVCVDFSGFNRRFAHAIRQYTRARQDWFHDWNPRIIQYVSTQVWASRAGRVYQMAEDFDLVVSIFPFEPAWYAARVPRLRVEFVGNPVLDRYGRLEKAGADGSRVRESPTVVLLPGSRPGELARHLPVLLGALERIRAAIPRARARMVLPNEALLEQAKRMGLPEALQVQVGDLASALREADLGLASTGTVTLECAYFGVPAVALYKTSWPTWQIAKRIITVKYGAMPNLLANEEIFPEFIQAAATADNIARAAIALLTDEPRRQKLKTRMSEVIASLGPPGAAGRAAKAIRQVLEMEHRPVALGA